MIRRATALVAAGLGCAAPSHAQQVSLRLGGLHARYSDSIVGEAGALAARLGWSGLRSRGIVEASWAQFTTGDAAGQAWTDITLIGPSSPRAAGGLRLSGFANAARGGPWSGLGIAELFGAYVVRAWTLGLSVAGGGVRSITQTSTPMGQVALRARLDLTRRWSMTAAATGTTAGAVHYADVTLTADWHRGRTAAGGLFGARAGDLRYKPWGQAWVSRGITPAASLEGSAGYYPRDLTGFDHGAFVNVGLRVSLFSRTSDYDDVSTAIYARTLLPEAPSDAFVEPIDSASARVTFRVPGATGVSITGEWNDWTPAPLVDDGAGRWTGVIPVGTGVYRFALVADGGRQVIPAGVTKLSDDFDGEVGLLIVK